MRLSAIKLAGFKSFVDPTTFYAPTNLTGIVGPNGCGKSNIIDAVRWVMGEGSAKVLRGESMADVIFSGSSTRKPVGTATVELLFDNSDGRVAGQFAGYNEISVKRQVSRDGVSIYYLNGTRCRRKDVRDLFLGTGLGSRSYSIIEQGMISEVVEARPEEIRGHLEEAAGISKYKERRRETERRIQHTRDNLDRLADLRDEVGKHLGRLKRQANAAERYKKLKQERRELESRLLAVHWKYMMQKADAGKQDLAQRETSLQESIAEQRAAEAALEKLHQEQGQASEAFNEVQGDLYGVGSEIARLEQTIKHARDLMLRQQQEYDETQSALKDLEKHMVLDKAQVEDLTQALAEVEPALESAQKEEKTAADALIEAESDVAEWQKAFEQHHSRSTDSNRAADRSRSEIEVLDQRLVQASRRIEVLDAESRTIDTEDMQAEIESLQSKSLKLAKSEKDGQQSLDKLRGELESLQDGLRKNDEEMRKQQHELHTSEGRLASLQALQQAALEDQGAEDWLKERGLESAPRLAQRLKVDAGWEAAVEVVLGHWLQSVLIESGNEHRQVLATLDATSLDLIESQSGKVKAKAGSLAAKVRGPDTVIAWLNGIRTADALDDAWQIMPKLGEEDSVITRSGEWIGAGWIRVARSHLDEDSMLAREKSIARLEKDVARLQASTGELREQIESAREQTDKTETKIRELQAEVNQLHRSRNEVDGKLESKQASIQHLSRRQTTVASERKELREQIASDEKDAKKGRAALEQLVGDMAGLKEERDSLEAQRSQLMSVRDEARQQLATARDRRHEMALKAGSKRASLDSLRQSLERMDTQLSQLQQRYLSLSETVAKTASPEQLHKEEMDALLQRRVETEARLGEARATVQALEESYRQKDANRQKAIQRSDDIRQDLERARLKQQELELNARNIQRQVEELEADVATLAEGLPEEVDPDQWEEELERLQVRITRLEPVNLAAISEFEEEQKRKEYLDQQNDDLVEALTTLENAIAKIDRTTRTRFKETFERVNKGVQELFPRLFGGGHAYLELTGEDLLTTGVTIMAQPPGKRVSSLHLLSGGEKALTAVSFVFSIFRLNPAPFCLLDEVDAPLDDANVIRFSSMVKEMSDKVQFIVVTHNKITMEMAYQMSGVTMREPGVSRLVQVDIDEAARLAAS